jgi:hypothetical protein
MAYYTFSAQGLAPVLQFGFESARVGAEEVFVDGVCAVGFWEVDANNVSDRAVVTVSWWLGFIMCVEMFTRRAACQFLWEGCAGAEI